MKIFKKGLKAFYLIMIVLLLIPNSPVNILADELDNNSTGSLRAVWITPITGDVSSFSSEANYKNEMNGILDMLEHYNINAIIYHVRTYNEALYKSELNPKSTYFRNVNFNVFDPLEWLIAEVKSRGMEFHAWLNPYRVSSNYYATSLPALNPASNSDNLITYDGKTILNPGIPEVRQFLVDTVTEIIENYDVDAIHFDDYFYMSLETNGTDIVLESDQDTFLMYQGNFPNTHLGKSDWRREQINLMIEAVSNKIKLHNINNNKFVQFGVSPTGIYKNGNGIVTYDNEGKAITTGSNTGGQTHFSSYLFSDSLKWLNEGWLDYIIPQSYWATNHNVASYYEVMGWWNKVVKNLNVNLYSGIGLYMAREVTSSFNWINSNNEMSSQLTHLNSLENTDGFAIFTLKDVKSAYNNDLNHPKVVANLNNAKDTHLTNIIPLPQIKSMEAVNLGKVNNLKHENGILSWDSLANAKAYYIYKSANELTFANDEIIKVIGSNNLLEFVTNDLDDDFNYGIRALSPTNHLGVKTTLKDSYSTQMIDGASIRNSTETTQQGLRFYAKLNDVDVDEFGFYLIYGDAGTQEILNELTINPVNPYINGKKVFNVISSGVNENQMFSVVLVGIPLIGYFQNITVVSYSKTDNKISLSDDVVTRSILEVALKMTENDDTNNATENILNYMNSDIKYVEVISDNVFSFNNNYYELDINNLKLKFINDWNNKFNTNFNDFDLNSFHNSSKEGIEIVNGNAPIVNTNIYKFFNDDLYKYKWDWLLEFLRSVDSTVHTTNQINAILDDIPNNNLYNLSHLNATLYNFFNEDHRVLGYTAINFTDSSKYNTLINYNDKIFINIKDKDLYNTGDTFNISKYNTLNLDVDYFIYNQEVFNDTFTVKANIGVLEVFYNENKYNTLEELKIAFLTDYHAFLNSGVDLQTFIHGAIDGSFNGLWQDNLRTMYTLGIPIKGDNTTFINTSKYYDKWFGFMDFLDDLVTEINSTQSLWGSTYTGDIRIKAYFTDGTNFTEEMLLRWPEGYQK